MSQSKECSSDLIRKHKEVLKRAIISQFATRNCSNTYHAVRRRNIEGLNFTIYKDDYISFCQMLGYYDLIDSCRDVYYVNNKDLGVELDKMPKLNLLSARRKE